MPINSNLDELSSRAREIVDFIATHYFDKGDRSLEEIANIYGMSPQSLRNNYLHRAKKLYPELSDAYSAKHPTPLQKLGMKLANDERIQATGVLNDFNPLHATKYDMVIVCFLSGIFNSIDEIASYLESRPTLIYDYKKRALRSPALRDKVDNFSFSNPQKEHSKRTVTGTGLSSPKTKLEKGNEDNLIPLILPLIPTSRLTVQELTVIFDISEEELKRYAARATLLKSSHVPVLFRAPTLSERNIEIPPYIYNRDVFNSLRDYDEGVQALVREGNYLHAACLRFKNIISNTPMNKNQRLIALNKFKSIIDHIVNSKDNSESVSQHNKRTPDTPLIPGYHPGLKPSHGSIPGSGLDR